jgi:hypothetical protein
VLAELGAGDALDTAVRSRMESAFGITLPDVRVHRGARAAALADRFRARAFTLGHHIAFARGAWRPGSPGGDLLIAHELAHVLQQRDHTAAETGEEHGLAGDRALERDAGAAAVGATLSLWGRLAGAARSVVGAAAPRLRSGLALQRCDTKTPDGVSVGPTDRSKIFCLKPGSFVSSTSVGTNTTTSATGRQDMTFEGLNTGTQEGKPCRCDCGLYRHWIRGFWRSGSAAGDKQYDFTSCGHTATLKETDYIEEYTSCIGDNDPAACKWGYSDWPGWSSGLSDGAYISLSYDFAHQVWDRCQGRSVAIHTKSLRISGDTAPRSITWT